MLMIGIFTGCFEDESVTPEEQLQKDLASVDQDQLASDIQLIDTYLDTLGIDAIEDDTGLRYVIHEEGEGKTPELADKIRVRYVGTVLGEEEPFDSNNDVTFTLNNLIVGWKVGFKQLQEGDSATLYIPSGLGYGEVSRPKIPANSNLKFVVKLLEVERF